MTALVRTADGQLLSAGMDGVLRRWDGCHGRSLGPPLRTNHLEVWSVVVLPNGDWITGGREGLLQWWHRGERHGSAINGGQGAISALLALPNKTLLSAGEDGKMRLWSPKGQLQRIIKSGHSSVFTLL